MYKNYKYFHTNKTIYTWPVWLSWLGHLPVDLLKGHKFDSPPGHMPGLWVPSPVRACTRGNQLMFLSHIDVFAPLSPSLPLSLKSISMSSGENKNKQTKLFTILGLIL